MMIKKSNPPSKDDLRQKSQQQKPTNPGLAQEYTKTQTAELQKKPLTQTPLEKRKGPTTRIIIKYDVGFNNAIYLRGKGANLSWDKGVLLKNVKPDEWVWETDQLFTTCEFKVLINDQSYELGDNHPLSCGASIQYTPKF